MEKHTELSFKIKKKNVCGIIMKQEKACFLLTREKILVCLTGKNCKNANMDKNNFPGYLGVGITCLALIDAQVISKAFAERRPTKEWSEGNNPVKLSTVIFPDHKIHPNTGMSLLV